MKDAWRWAIAIAIMGTLIGGIACWIVDRERCAAAYEDAHPWEPVQLSSQCP